MIQRRLLMGGGGAFTPSNPNYVAIYNGTAADLDYDLGFASTTDYGVTWTKDAGNPVLTKGAGGTWNDESIVQPSLFWDSIRSRWVLYSAGYTGSVWAIGRWFNTNADLVANPTTWTQDVGNPVLTGSGNGVNLPFVFWEPVADITRIWYTILTAQSSIGYAEVVGTSGVLTGVGEVIPIGAGGTFSDEGIVSGPILKLGPALWRVYVGGQQGTVNPDYRAGYCETTDPDNPGAYTTPAVIASLNANVVLGGRTFRSSYLNSVIELNPTNYLGFGTAIHPTDASGDEVSFRTTSTDGLTWTTPTGPLLALTGWESNSAENPTVVAA